MPNPISLAIVGATGAVGQELLLLLKKRSFPIKSLRCFASERSSGKHLSFDGARIPVEVLTEGCLKGCDMAIFSAGKKISLAHCPKAAAEGTLVIDNSSAFRMVSSVPLVIPEINAHALKRHQGIIASPNCSTTIMLMPLAPLHRAYRIKRIVAATYQAASGAGAAAVAELEEQTRCALEQRPLTCNVFPFPYAFNLFTHNSPMTESGYAEEEVKMLQETQKILEDDTIAIHATCVRVPILRAHSEALNVEFHTRVTKEAAYALLKNTSGVEILEDRGKNRFPMPTDATGKEAVFCGRIREDLSQPNTLDLWVVGDQLLKGAALNAVQIAETVLKNH